MKPRYFLLFATLLSSLGASEPTTLQPFFQEHCVQCHGAKKQKGDVRLDDVSTLDGGTWADIYEQLASEEMPPDDEPEPTDAERKTFLGQILAYAQQEAPPASTGFRRLNKREYGYTVRDLLGLRKGIFDPGEYIYEDEIDEGFDTAADSLVISNELLLEYMGAAEKSLRHALFSPDREKPESRVIDVKMARMRGVSSRYVNHHRDHVIFRVSGKEKLYDGERTRTMTTPGRYVLTVTASGVDRDRYPVKFVPAEGPLILGVGIMPDGVTSVSGKGRIQETFELKDGVDQSFQCEMWIDKDHYPYLYFVNGSSKPITQVRSNIRRRKLKPSAVKEPFVGPGIRVSQFRVDGPFHDEWPPASFRATYGSEKIPDLEQATAREQLLHRFATRAFRRPVAQEDVAPYLRFLDQQHSATGDWHDSIIRTFAAMMTSLDFLYLHENEGQLDAFALTNRLSYFLWRTMPDEELFGLARSGRLLKPSILREQVTRLLDDPRSARFCESFADQWLSLDLLGTMPPDGRTPGFRAYFNDQLEPAMLEETRRFFRHLLLENRSVQDFLDADYSFLNHGLAKLYGVPFEGGKDEWKRVAFPAGVKRGGLLGHGSILTLTSNGVETSPVVRGHWVLDELLGTPPPPPPKEVPALVPDLNGAETVRQLLEKHRSDPSCIDCHRQMDPLGFALESFDPIGRFRSDYSKTMPVSSHGTFRGQDFADISQLKQILVTDLQPFARNLTIRMAEYAKGRQLTPIDFPGVERIVEQTASDGFPLRDILIEIATGDLLRQR